MLPSANNQRRSQDFCLGGGHPADVTRYIFRDLLKPTRFSGGGGVVAEIFRDLLKPTTFSGGGGVVGEIFQVNNNQITSIPGHFFTFQIQIT